MYVCLLYHKQTYRSIRECIISLLHVLVSDSEVQVKSFMVGLSRLIFRISFYFKYIPNGNEFLKTNNICLFIYIQYFFKAIFVLNAFLLNEKTESTRNIYTYGEFRNFQTHLGVENQPSAPRKARPPTQSGLTVSTQLV